MTKDIFDFRGGYVTSTPPEQMADNEVIAGTNVYYDGKLKKRPGWVEISPDGNIIDTNTVRGFISLEIPNSGDNDIVICAVDNGTDVRFYDINGGGAGTELHDPDSADFTFTKAYDVEMVQFDDVVICVNGVDKPAIIYPGGGTIDKLENYDERSRGDDEWYAGQWDDGASPEFVDDTTDAQDVEADDFLIATGGTNNDGFYIAGVSTFNKVVLTSASQFDGSPVAEYRYYAGGGTWAALTLTSTPSWTAAAGDRTLEFDIPLDSDGSLLWVPYGDVDTQVDPTGVTGGVLNRYLIRVRFTTAPTSDQTCDYATITHRQYLTQIFEGNVPTTVAVHQNRLFLGVGNSFRFSPPGSVTGWYAQDIEYTPYGGDIISMASGGDFLGIIKRFGYYRYFGTTTDNFVLQYGGAEGGSSKRGSAGVGPAVVYLSHDGIRVMGPSGDTMLISKSIASEYTPADGDWVINWNGNILVGDPSADVMYWGDPDTLRQDSMGDGRLSWWKWTGVNADLAMFRNMPYSVEGAGYPAIGVAGVIILDADNKAIRISNESVGYDRLGINGTATNIPITLQTKYFSFGLPLVKKIFRRLKLDISQSGTWTLTVLSDEGAKSVTATIASGSSTGHYRQDISLGYALDGYNVSVKLQNQTNGTGVEVYGFTLDQDRRAF